MLFSFFLNAVFKRLNEIFKIKPSLLTLQRFCKLRSHGKPDRSPTSTHKMSGFGDYTIKIVSTDSRRFVNIQHLIITQSRSFFKPSERKKKRYEKSSEFPHIVFI